MMTYPFLSTLLMKDQAAFAVTGFVSADTDLIVDSDPGAAETLMSASH